MICSRKYIPGIYLIALLTFILFFLVSCGHHHDWKDATCDAPKTCADCGETQGEKLIHTVSDDGTCKLCKKAISVLILDGEKRGVPIVLYDGVKLGMQMRYISGDDHIGYPLSYVIYDQAGALIKEGSWPETEFSFPPTDETNTLDFNFTAYTDFFTLDAGSYTIKYLYYDGVYSTTDHTTNHVIFHPYGSEVEASIPILIKAGATDAQQDHDELGKALIWALTILLLLLLAVFFLLRKRRKKAPRPAEEKAKPDRSAAKKQKQKKAKAKVKKAKTNKYSSQSDRYIPVNIQIFLRQMLRSTKRLLLNGLLLTVTSAFFVMSMNLYYNSQGNLQKIKDAYATIGTVEFYGNVDKQGNLVTPGTETHLGYQLMAPKGYDLSKLTNYSNVLNYDLRYRCLAYIAGEAATGLRMGVDDEYRLDAKEAERVIGSTYNVLRFTIRGDQPIKIPLRNRILGAEALEKEVPVTITYQGASHLNYGSALRMSFSSWSDKYAAQYADQIKQVNRSEDTDCVILYPSVEYIMLGTSTNNLWLRNAETGIFSWDQANPHSSYPDFNLQSHFFDCIYGTLYYKGSNSFSGGAVADATDREQPFYIQRWEDVQADAESAAYWEDLAQSMAYTAGSFAVTTTNDIRMVPAWHLGGMYLHSGRMITAEEYQTGARVCMVSAELAAAQGWQLGDKLDMNFYLYDAFFDRSSSKELYTNGYSMAHDGFFDQGQYEIVGFYAQNELQAMEGIAEQVMYQPWNAIYMPTAAMNNLPPQEEWSIQPSLLTLKLENGSAVEHLEAMIAQGLTEGGELQHTLKFHYFDQGYSSVEPGVTKMQLTAKILLSISGVLLLVTLVLAAYFFAQQHKHSAGILRVLGGSKIQALAGILTCALLLALVSAAIGSLSGGILGQVVGSSILSGNKSSGDAAVNGALLMSSGSIDAGIVVGSDPVVTALGGLGIVAVFALLLTVFAAIYLKQEPRDLLPKGKE